MTTPTFKQSMLLAPDHQLDASLKLLIEKWSEPPTSLELLEVLDTSIYAGLASDFVVTALEVMLNETLINENKQLLDIIPYATWRKN